MKKKLIITPMYDWMTEHPDIIPQPAKNYIPEWYKNTPIDNLKTKDSYKLIPIGKTIRTCPSFMDVFKDGFVIPAPCDIWFYVGEHREQWEWKTSTDIFNTPHYNFIEQHDDGQMVEHLPNKNIVKIFKMHTPWWFKAPKGYSIRQLPLMYHYENTDWFVPYGIVKSDQYVEFNPQICITSKNTEVLIKKGSPLCYLVPYKRSNKLDLKIEPLKKHRDNITSSIFNVVSSFRSNYHRYED